MLTTAVEYRTCKVLLDDVDFIENMNYKFEPLIGLQCVLPSSFLFIS